MAEPTPNPHSVPVDVERYFQVSLYLLIVTAYFTLVSTGKLDSLSVMLVAVALLFRGYQVSKDRQSKIPERWTGYLTVLYVGLYIADYSLISNNNFVTASIHLVLFIIVVKMFSIHRDRDYIYLTVLSFLVVLAAAILTVDAVFLASFSLFALIAASTFISMEMRRSARNAVTMDLSGLEHSLQKPVRFHIKGPRAGLHVALIGATAAIVVAILLSSVLIFFMLPRLSGGYLSRLAQQSSMTTGFSDNINLGEIGRIQQSDEIVLHVKVEDEIPGTTELLLRGVVLTNFSGSRWSNVVRRPEILQDFAGHYDLRSTASLSTDDARTPHSGRLRPVRYRVAAEPLMTNVLFALPATRTLAGRFRMIGIETGGGLLNLDRERAAGIYYGVSENNSLDESILRRADGPEPKDVAESYLQLPKLDPRVHELAARITADTPTTYDKAAAVSRYLQTNYGYTLQLPSSKLEDPLSNFLFERKRGHCEYFATSMAVMLRTVGVPARIVTGFRGGEFNNLTDEYIIRARDAHSWVEVYFPGEGWVAFDPTPASGAPTQTTWNRFLLYMDAAREFWREWVVNYDFAHQQQLSTAAVVKSRRFVDDVRDWAKARYDAMLNFTRRAARSAAAAPGRSVGYIAGALFLACFLIGLPQIIRTVRRVQTARRPERNPSNAASIWYERLTHRLGRLGWRKMPVQTPDEWKNTITDSELREAVERFTVHYERARFGESATDAQQLPQLFEHIFEEIVSKK